MNTKQKASRSTAGIVRGIYTFDSKSNALAKEIARSKDPRPIERKQLGEELIRASKGEANPFPSRKG